MRIIPFLICTAITAGLIIVFNSNFVLPAPLGKLLSPQHGIWQNAEPANHNFSEDLSFSQLGGPVTVYFDERLVPHVFAEQETDAYFVQGYLHAKFRLWQMELQTIAAAGRASEILGEKALTHDREFRRLGMVSGAEITLQEIEKDPFSKSVFDAYTAGINQYIETLTESSLPLEYKLIGYKPEKWNNLKTALFAKYMSYDLAGHDDDFEMTNARNYFSKDDFDKIYPAAPDSLEPVIPRGTTFVPPAINLHPPPGSESIYGSKKDFVQVSENKPNKDNGSNNWAVSGTKTKSGSPILCNDPHLGLNLPSLWFEMQISTPGFNAYGVGFPGFPGIIIGFNDSCAWGLTNCGRDVRDYYEITFKDDSRKEYWFDREWKKTEFRVERIRVKGMPDYMDTVAYTLFGPVMYDKNFGGYKNDNKKYYAVRWKGNDPSNELQCFMLMNKAKNYSDYLVASSHLHTAGQNFAFACKNGDIAIRTQGEFPAKWKGQGDFIMPGTDTTYQWQSMIPPEEMPFLFNPSRGFVSSANQRPTDTLYPYYLGRGYPPYRAIIINRKLNEMNQATCQDMMKLQTSTENIFAKMAIPIFLKNIRESELDDDQKKYFSILKNWNFQNDPDEKGATIFYLAWKAFQSIVWSDEFEKAPDPIMVPYESTLLEGVLKDSAYKFLDNINTIRLETLPDDITTAFKASALEMKKADAENRLSWAKFKDTKIMHLTKLDPLSRRVEVGGGRYCINAIKSDHGPSWRMIVSLTSQTEAYGVYPGGQSGNPGSRFYDNFVDTWAAGKYFPLRIIKIPGANNKSLPWKMTFNKM
ncbi:MAG: penicillin acylase family protein [Ginsengibacter sp.]